MSDCCALRSLLVVQVNSNILIVLNCLAPDHSPSSTVLKCVKHELKQLSNISLFIQTPSNGAICYFESFCAQVSVFIFNSYFSLISQLFSMQCSSLYYMIKYISFFVSTSSVYWLTCISPFSVTRRFASVSGSLWWRHDNTTHEFKLLSKIYLEITFISP